MPRPARRPGAVAGLRRGDRAADCHQRDQSQRDSTTVQDRLCDRFDGNIDSSECDRATVAEALSGGLDHAVLHERVDRRGSASPNSTPTRQRSSDDVAHVADDDRQRHILASASGGDHRVEVSCCFGSSYWFVSNPAPSGVMSNTATGLSSDLGGDRGDHSRGTPELVAPAEHPQHVERHRQRPQGNGNETGEPR